MVLALFFCVPMVANAELYVNKDVRFVLEIPDDWKTIAKNKVEELFETPKKSNMLVRVDDIDGDVKSHEEMSEKEINIMGDFLKDVLIKSLTYNPYFKVADESGEVKTASLNGKRILFFTVSIETMPKKEQMVMVVGVL